MAPSARRRESIDPQSSVRPKETRPLSFCRLQSSMQYTNLTEESSDGQKERLNSNGTTTNASKHRESTGTTTISTTTDMNHHDADNDDDEEMGSVALSSLSSKLSRRKPPNNTELQQPLTNNSIRTEEHPQKQDPFYVFREDLYDKLDLVEESLTDYLRIVHQTDTAVNTHDLRDTKKQLKRHLKNAERTLKDVQTTVRLVESQPDKFAVTSSDLYDRNSLVQTSHDRILKAKHDMNSDTVKSKLLADERAKQMRRAQQQQQHNDSMGSNGTADGENTAFIVDTAARTSLLLQNQDETLDELDEAVTRVGDMAGGIHDEINVQSKMLDEMEDDLADAEEKLGIVMGKLAKMLKTKDKCQLGSILLLIAAVVVLFFLVVYT